jgi:hypothetical protein
MLIPKNKKMTETTPHPDLGHELHQPPHTDQLDLLADGTLETTNGLPPIGELQVPMHGQDGPVRYDALASIRIPQENGSGDATVIVAANKYDKRDKPSELALIEFNEEPVLDGRVLIPSGGSLNSDPSKAGLELDTGRLSVNASLTKSGRQVRIGWNPATRSDGRHGDVVVTIADTAEGKVRSAGETFDRVDRLRKLRVAGRAMLVAAAVSASFKTGGVADQALDYFQDAGNVVHETLDVPAMPDRLDGIKVTDFPLEARQSLTTEHDKEQSSVDRIAQTMQDMDDHKYSAISQRAETFRQQHAGELMTKEQQARLSVELENTTTNQDALATFNKFLTFYGKTADFTSKEVSEKFAFDPATPPEDTRIAIQAIMSTYAPLPASLLKNADFPNIHLMSPTDGTYGLSNGNHASEDRSISLPVSTKVDVVARASLHEIGHAVQVSSTSQDSEETNTALYLLSRLADMPTDVTDYAAHDGGDERDAEVFARATNIKELVPHPDDARLFSSEATAQILHKIKDLEDQFPGITDYMMEKNPNFGKTYDR